MKYDLEDRTAKFGESVIIFVKSLENNLINKNLIDQLIRAGTSIGANYCEANQASSKKDFVNKLYICKKEANETKFWLRMIVKANPSVADTCRKLWQEAQELTLIFSKAISTSKT